MSIVLRHDQAVVRDKLRIAMRDNDAVLINAVTGWGKTVFAGALSQSIISNKKRVIFGVHRKELLKQTALTFEKFQIPFSYIASGMHHNPRMPVQIASIPTLQNRLDLFRPDVYFNDEAHLSVAAGQKQVLDYYKDQNAKLIGLTGSPIRLDGKPLGDVWDKMIDGPSMRWLIDRGFLSQYRAFSPAIVDTSGLHTSNGEFKKSEAEALMAGKAVLSNAVGHWRALADGLRTIAFAPSIKRAEDLAAEFCRSGIVAVALDGNTPVAERRKVFIAFARREIKVIVNCQLFCEGFDLAAQVDEANIAVECVLDCAPTQSLAKHLQKFGRGLRTSDLGRPHILIDLVGNFARHGLPDEDRIWSLDGMPESASVSGEKSETIMTCTNCFHTHRPMPACPRCGIMHVIMPREVKMIDGELVEINQGARRESLKAELGEAKTLDQLIALAGKRGYSMPEQWASKVWTKREAQKQGLVA